MFRVSVLWGICLLLKHIVNHKCKISVEKKKMYVLLCTNDVLGHTKVGNECPLSKESVKKIPSINQYSWTVSHGDK